MSAKAKKEKKANKSEDNGFLSGLMSIFGFSSPEQKKKQMFKAIAKDIMRSRYKFYRPKGNLVLPALAKYLFEIHRVTINTVTLLKNAKNSKELKAVCIEAFLTEEQSALLKLFDKNTVRESAVKRIQKLMLPSLRQI